MIFIVRGAADTLATPPGVRVLFSRRTPAQVADAADQRDLVCVTDEAVLDRLREAGCSVVLMHDGWYADDATGGVAVWGDGRFWELRDTPFVVKEGDNEFFM